MHPLVLIDGHDLADNPDTRAWLQQQSFTAAYAAGGPDTIVPPVVVEVERIPQ